MSILGAGFVETLVYPPAGPMLLMLTALALKRRRRTAWTLASLGWVTLYLAASPAVSLMLLGSLEHNAALTPATAKASRAQAIVVISGGRYADAPEYGGDTSSASELERLRYAAYLQRRTGLPLVVSGGDPLNQGAPAAAHMKRILENEFGVPVRWVARRSRMPVTPGRCWNVRGSTVSCWSPRPGTCRGRGGSSSNRDSW
jgi:uncharacterized SAM-binding protein YcdF (DUF218 family)